MRQERALVPARLAVARQVVLDVALPREERRQIQRLAVQGQARADRAERPLEERLAAQLVAARRRRRRRRQIH